MGTHNAMTSSQPPTPPEPAVSQIAEDAAMEIIPGEYESEGSGTIEDMQDAYDHNESLIRRRVEVAAHVQRAINLALSSQAALHAADKERLTDSVNGLTMEAEERDEVFSCQLADMRHALEGFLTKGQSLGASHPHFADYIYFPKEVWDAARSAARTNSP
jgi:hypothetical protein